MQNKVYTKEVSEGPKVTAVPYVMPHLRTSAEKDALLFGKKVGKFVTTGELPKERAKPKHEEADLHLSFCKWVNLQYPNNQFIRHEREGKRSWYMQNLFKIYNSDLDKMPDFELLEPSGKTTHTFFDDYGYEESGVHFKYYRLYIEFKKPGTNLLTKDGFIKPEYAEQHKRHIRFWEQNSPAYFCSNFDEAVAIFNAYKAGNPLPQQIFKIR